MMTSRKLTTRKSLAAKLDVRLQNWLSVTNHISSYARGATRMYIYR